jgi:hypothetical protein
VTGPRRVNAPIYICPGIPPIAGDGIAIGGGAIGI